MSEHLQNGNNSDEPEEAKSYNLLELLELEKELEEESAAVLGGSDEKCCTYNTGYIKRQALYSCLTCCPESKDDISKAAGICLACSYKCHENHEMIELYTKRNFRCDCPTKQIVGTQCSFVSEATESASTSANDGSKFDKNTSNVYDHNFAGTYCTCKRPYPDPEDPISDEMIQCVVCEDWYHTRHLESEVIPKTNEYFEMICGKCIQKYDFLKYYLGMAVNKIIPCKSDDEAAILDTSATKEDISCEEKNENADIIPDSAETSEKLSAKQSEENDETPCKKRKIEETDCKKPKVIPSYYEKGAVFWPDDWRNSLCTCDGCKTEYAEKKVPFLLDPEDTVLVYEEKGLKKFDTYNDWLASSLSNLGHTQKIDLINGYNHFKDKLKTFFDSFATEGKVITETDVKNFFQKLYNEKAEFLHQQSQPQFFCR